MAKMGHYYLTFIRLAILVTYVRSGDANATGGNGPEVSAMEIPVNTLFPVEIWDLPFYSSAIR
jgi:hypothetical protein